MYTLQISRDKKDPRKQNFSTCKLSPLKIARADYPAVANIVARSTEHLFTEELVVNDPQVEIPMEPED